MNNIIKIILCIIILYILYCNIFQSNNSITPPNLTNQIIPNKENITGPNTHTGFYEPVNKNCDINKFNNDKIMKYKFDNLKEKHVNIAENNQKIINYDKPNPWTKLIIYENNEYPYYFHIKINIPSLNDYTNWKNIIPNLDFNVSTGELVIPSPDEASALAIVNLIIINFNGDLKLDEIINQNLIETSIAKAKTHEVVQHKLREQINQNLLLDHSNNKLDNTNMNMNTNTPMKPNIEYEKDLDKESSLNPEPYDGDNYMYFN